MTRTGTIKLIYKGMETAVRPYKSGTDRKNIIEYWKLMYAERFNQCAIQINPDTFERRTLNTSRQLGLNNIQVNI